MRDGGPIQWIAFLLILIRKLRFNSKYISPGCSAVDALAQDRSADNNWLCPPVHLIVSVCS